MREAVNPDYLNLEGDGFPDLDACRLWNRYGKVVQLTGNLLEAEGVNAATGDICRIVHAGSPHPILAEVIGFESNRIKMSPLTHMSGVRPGSLVEVYEAASSVMVSKSMLGRVLDGLGQPLDGGPPIISHALLPACRKSIKSFEPAID